MAQMSSELKKLQKREKSKYAESVRSPDRAPVKLPPSVLAPTNLSFSNEQEKDEGVEISGLTDKRFCT